MMLMTMMALLFCTTELGVKRKKSHTFQLCFDCFDCLRGFLHVKKTICWQVSQPQSWPIKKHKISHMRAHKQSQSVCGNAEQIETHAQEGINRVAEAPSSGNDSRGAPKRRWNTTKNTHSTLDTYATLLALEFIAIIYLLCLIKSKKITLKAEHKNSEGRHTTTTGAREQLAFSISCVSATHTQVANSVVILHILEKLYSDLKHFTLAFQQRYADIVRLVNY